MVHAPTSSGSAAVAPPNNPPNQGSSAIPRIDRLQLKPDGFIAASAIEALDAWHKEAARLRNKVIELKDENFRLRKALADIHNTELGELIEGIEAALGTVTRDIRSLCRDVLRSGT